VDSCKPRSFVRTTSILYFTYAWVLKCNYIHLFIYSWQPVKIAAQSKAWTVFARSDARIVGSNHIQGMDVWCMYAFMLSCAYVAALRRADHSSKESYRLWKMITELNKRPGHWMGWKRHWKKIFLAYLTTVLIVPIIFIIKKNFCEYTVFLNPTLLSSLKFLLSMLSLSLCLITDYLII
jgi:hypothetical protein